MMDPAAHETSPGAPTHPRPTMDDDIALLRRYADDGTEAAFAELVRRHVNFVHSAALRQVNGDAHLAADATQLVFTDLARKAKALASHQVLGGWLFTSTRYAARNLVRGEQRRRAREQEALQMENLDQDEGTPELDWQRVRGVLDDVINELGRADREAVLLRFFEGRDYTSVGAKLNLSPNTARMRVERALEKLRDLLERRGVVSTSAALGAALAGQAVAAAPVGLAATVTGAALAGAATTTGTLAVIFMSVTKLQMGSAAALMVAGVTGFVVQAGDNNDVRAEIAVLQRQNMEVAHLRAENERLSRAAAEVADLRLDDAWLTQLSDEALALQAQWRKIAAAERARDVKPLAPLTGPIFDVAKLDQPPTPKVQARPMYPVEMRKAGLGGEVLVSFVVDAEGAVRDLKAEKSSRSEFEAVAIEALERWKFSPGMKDGSKVNTRVKVPIVFTLNDGKPGPVPALWF